MINVRFMEERFYDGNPVIVGTSSHGRRGMVIMSDVPEEAAKEWDLLHEVLRKDDARGT